MHPSKNSSRYKCIKTSDEFPIDANPSLAQNINYPLIDDVSSENLVLPQDNILQLMSFFILITCLVTMDVYFKEKLGV